MSRAGDAHFPMRRPFTIALLLFEAFFFNVIIPVHTRGMIQLPGSRGASCCASRHTGSKQDAPDRKSAANCAVCAFAARVTVPPTIDLSLAPLERLGIVLPQTVTLPVARDLLLAYDGRGPPAFA